LPAGYRSPAWDPRLLGRRRPRRTQPTTWGWPTPARGRPPALPATTTRRGRLLPRYPQLRGRVLRTLTWARGGTPTRKSLPTRKGSPRKSSPGWPAQTGWTQTSWGVPMRRTDPQKPTPIPTDSRILKNRADPPTTRWTRTGSPTPDGGLALGNSP